MIDNAKMVSMVNDAIETAEKHEGEAKGVREAMLANLVDVVNHTGSATMIGDDSYKIIVPWCIANCSKRFCFDGEAQVVMFESAEDCTLFMTARPQTPS